MYLLHFLDSFTVDEEWAVPAGYKAGCWIFWALWPRTARSPAELARCPLLTGTQAQKVPGDAGTERVSSLPR